MERSEGKNGCNHPREIELEYLGEELTNWQTNLACHLCQGAYVSGLIGLELL